MKRASAFALALLLLLSSALFAACNTPGTPSATTSGTNEITGVVFSDVVYTYDGLPKELVATGLPLGVTAVYTNNVATNAGSYTATAILTGVGYNPKQLTATMTIEKANFVGLTLNGGTLSYDGQPHALAVSGDLPAGTTVSYTYNDQSVSAVTDAGSYAVKATVTNPNYNTLELTAELVLSKTAFGSEYGLALSGKTFEQHGKSCKLEVTSAKPLPADTTITYYYNDRQSQGNTGVSATGGYQVRAVVTTKNHTEELTATMQICERLMNTDVISVSDILASAPLTNGEFYDHGNPSNSASEGIVANGAKQTSFGIGPTAESGGMSYLSYIGGATNDVLVKTGGVAVQKGVAASRYYVEAVFNAYSTAYTIGNGFAGLMVATGTDWVLSANEPDATRLMISLHGNNILSCATYGWGYNSTQAKLYNGTETLIQVNWTQFFTAQELSAMDLTKVRLGVLRYDNNNFAFFVNDRYCGSRSFGNINIANSGSASFGESAIGIASAYRFSGTTNQGLDNGGETILDFKYSTDTTLINRLRACVPEKSIDLYLIAGQSNAAGNAVFDTDTMYNHTPYAIYGNSNVLYRGAMTNYDWELAVVGQGEGAGGTKIGAEIGMMDYLSLATIGQGADTKYAYDASAGRYAGIIKTAVGGTGFDYAHSTTAEQNWLKNAGWWGSPSWIRANGYNTATTPVRNLYNELVANTVNGIRELQAAGFTEINIKGLFWMQGERHINTETAASPSTSSWYYKAFSAFISDLRSELNTKAGTLIGQDLSNMRVLMGEVSQTFGTGTMTTQATWNAKVAQNKKFIALQQFIAANISGVELLSTQAYPLNKWENGANVVLGTDHQHWNQNQMFEIGKLVGERMYNFN